MEFPIKVALAQAIPVLPEGSGWWYEPNVSQAQSLAVVGVGVLRDVPAHGLVIGNPARQVGWVCRCGRTLDAALRCITCRRTCWHDGDGLAEKQDPHLE
ncbi:hypothetical protein ACFYNF_38305 [Streptomyces sp. NPDC006641]|uniref:hypothetical protein n=1 Tax=unclassified Streptomyces TaxID=2593676 RepID=UPI002E783F74|nr:hypothetical protein [Streptomyces sp. JV184]MEE1745264.1 hypothetical protein [Streptomyces sp. JV184]